MQDASAFLVPRVGPDGSSVSPSSLSSRQAIIVLAWGILFWFAAAMFIRFAPPALFIGGGATALLFAASVPVAWASVWATRRLASLRPDQTVAGVALASAAAMLCDGVGLTWSALYGVEGSAPLAAAAWLLWGVGAILVAAFAAARNGSA